MAAIHRQASSIAAQLGEAPPSYGTTYSLVRGLAPAMVTLAHEGSKAYTDTFDLVHRHEATGPNAIWQADHTELDIWMKDGRGQPRKPWLTIILDDYSRAVAGYASIVRRAVGDPDGPGAAPGDLAEGPAGLAGLRHPGASSIPITAATSRPGTSNKWPPTSRSA